MGRQGEGHPNGTEHADALRFHFQAHHRRRHHETAGNEEAQDEREGIRTEGNPERYHLQ